MKEPNYKELCELQEKKMRIIKEQLKIIMKYINKDIYGEQNG